MQNAVERQHVDVFLNEQLHTIDHKRTRSGYETIIRRWDEFQVTTIEEQDGKYVMYYNTLRKFSRAPRTTPVNRWILAKRLNGGEVPASVIK